jgi:hypothetical protein
MVLVLNTAGVEQTMTPKTQLRKHMQPSCTLTQKSKQAKVISMDQGMPESICLKVAWSDQQNPRRH